MKKHFYFFAFLLLGLSSCLTNQKNIQKSENHHRIAVGLISECDKRRALRHLLKAIQLNPKDFLIRHTLATIYYSMGEYDKALIELKKILKIKSSFTEARVNLARIYIDMNQPDKSLKEIGLAEKDITYTNYLKLISQKALAYYKRGNYKNAKKWLTEAHSLPKGKNCFVYLHLGKAELALGELKQSELSLKEALSACAKEKPVCSEPNSEGHFVLARLYIKKGDKKRAKYHLNLFLRKTRAGTDLEKQARKLLKTISGSLLPN